MKYEQGWVIAVHCKIMVKKNLSYQSVYGDDAVLLAELKLDSIVAEIECKYRKTVFERCDVTV